MHRRVTVLVSWCLSVCVSVCLSVTTLAATSFVYTLKARYIRVCYRLFSVLTRGISKKIPFKGYGMKKLTRKLTTYLLRPSFVLFDHGRCTSCYLKAKW